jgi:hypothetical protein
MTRHDVARHGVASVGTTRRARVRAAQICWHRGLLPDVCFVTREISADQRQQSPLTLHLLTERRASSASLHAADAARSPSVLSALLRALDEHANAALSTGALEGVTLLVSADEEGTCVTRDLTVLDLRADEEGTCVTRDLTRLDLTCAPTRRARA